VDSPRQQVYRVRRIAGSGKISVGVKRKHAPSLRKRRRVPPPVFAGLDVSESRICAHVARRTVNPSTHKAVMNLPPCSQASCNRRRPPRRINEKIGGNFHHAASCNQFNLPSPANALDGLRADGRQELSAVPNRDCA